MSELRAGNRRYLLPMSTPGQPDHPGDSQPGGQSNPSGPGRPADPFAAGPQGPPGQGGQSGYPGGPGGYPAQQGYPSAPGGSPAQQGYPTQQGYPAQQGYGGQQGYAGQPPYPGGQAGYPGSYPGGADLPPEPVRPTTVTAAFWCWIATTVVSLIGLIITLTSPIWDQAVTAGLRQSNSTVQVDAQSVVTFAKVFLIVVFLIFAGVYLLFAFKMYAGRNWARIVLTVFGALALLSAFTPTSRSVTVNAQVFDVNSGQWASYLTGIIAIVGIVLMYLAPSNKFFADSKARRLQLKR